MKRLITLLLALIVAQSVTILYLANVFHKEPDTDVVAEYRSETERIQADYQAKVDQTAFELKMARLNNQIDAMKNK